MPDTPSNDGVYIVDTASLFAALEGHSAERRGLERMCRLLGMRTIDHMHNAGNDAHVRLITYGPFSDGCFYDLTYVFGFP